MALVASPVLPASSALLVAALSLPSTAYGKALVRHVRSAGERDMSGTGGARIIGIIQDITDIVEAQSRLTGAALDAGDAETDDNPPPVPLV